MSDPIIQVEDLSKKFILAHEGQEQYTTFRDVISRSAKKLVARPEKSAAAHSTEEFWALKDLNFSIRQGDRVGIVGRNGAGKSTLLKILSRITEPSTGTIRLKGRVASLLEVGTGFHPELTGRENIYLNGAILGMSRVEIRKKFDEIVDFSGVERFLDTPVKRYSSGMYVRLAFAVAAHLEPEILIIDEVLAVGDLEFQKKCLGKMEDVSMKEGRTVLFVSHNLQAISTLTNKVILLNQGRKVFDGNTGEGIQKYLEYMSSKELIYEQEPSDKKPRVTRVEVKTTDVNNVQVFGESLRIDFEITTSEPIPSTVFSFQIVNSAQVKVQHILIKDSETPLCRTAGVHKFSCYFPKLRLFPDKYNLIIHLSDHISRTKHETIEGICPFEVQIRGEVREYYWKTNEATYVDETEWIIN
ncbi:MAG TPA: polysaccharide ABC transporter ATP-binding protein [Puia sp.]